VALLDASNLHAPPPGASLYVLAPGSLPRRDPMKALLRLRRLLAPSLLAGPACAAGPFDRSPVHALVMTALEDPQETAWAALATGVRAAGRPVVVLVDRAVPGDSVTAALDAGAAAVVFACDGGTGDAELLAQAAEAERHRLDRAPLITVAICNRNGGRDLEDCLSSLTRVEYPSFEALVLDDGSTDNSREVGRRLGARVIELGAVGLGGARNAAIQHARGELVAYLDGDAQAEPGWLMRLWRLHDRLRPGGVGGPNLPVAQPTWQERAVGGAPGVAMPIVGADGRCTHLAGCNMSFRIDVAREAMFDPDVIYGDDVTFCYRVLDLGEDLLLHPTASVRHHRRRTLESYSRQMFQYGRWGTLMAARYGNRLVDGNGTMTLFERLDPRRPHRCFVGPQAKQRYNLGFAPLSNGFPLKLMTATLVLAGAATPVAWGLGRLRLLRALTLCGVLGQLGYVTVRTPVQGGLGGARGLGNRVLTALLWYLGPSAVAAGRARALREGAHAHAPVRDSG
jgi:glycosyltransferase involved in cell wall biosynthesis